MRRSGEDQKEAIRPEFDRSIMMDFQGARITSDVGFLLLREIDERFSILGPIGNGPEDSGSLLHTKHSLRQMARRRVYQIATGYEDCNDAGLKVLEDALKRSNDPLIRRKKKRRLVSRDESTASRSAGYHRTVNHSSATPRKGWSRNNSR